MRNVLIFLWLASCALAPASAQVSIGIGTPNVSIGINLPLYPELVPVPGYPVYYAPRLNSNYFFYDGMYWIYWDDGWYASSWYNGPWGWVAPEVVPVYVLRIPVRYYRQAPEYFRGWRPDAPPRWDEHWGHDWAQRRSGWDRWNRSAVPARPPLPDYQRKYSGGRYPSVEQQRALHSQHYRYQARDPLVRQHFESQRERSAPAQREIRGAPQQRKPEANGPQRSAQPPSVQQQSRQPGQGEAQHLPPAPRSRSQDVRPQTDRSHQGASQEPNRGQGPGQQKGREKSDDRPDERGQDRTR